MPAHALGAGFGQAVLRRWFLVALVILIPGGMFVGARAPAAAMTALQAVFRPSVNLALVAAVLFLMSVTLDNRQLRASLRRPGPVLWATIVNFGLLPPLGWLVSLAQLSPDFAAGVLIAACVPCTMAAASVWTRKAGGNDAIPLLVTLITNSACFVVTPLWLTLFSPGGAAAAIDGRQLTIKLIVSALLPIAAGQLLRNWRTVAAAADRHKILLGGLAQVCILVIVFWESIKAGPRVASGATSVGVLPVALVWISVAGLHLVAMGLGIAGAIAARFSPADRAAVAFAASQKTLPIGVAIAGAYSEAGLPLAVLPMILYHASQLFIDTAVAERLAASRMVTVENASDAS